MAADRPAVLHSEAPATPFAAAGREHRIRLTEIFHSLQGESSRAGLPTVFVRLTGCPLRCRYCDTAYAFHGGQWWHFEQILERVRGYGTQYVCITGGEPLAQRNCFGLLTSLCDEGFKVSLETSGALDASAVDPRVMRVIDIKTPDSGESHRNLLAQLASLRASDEIKFVICSRADYEWARDQLRLYPLEQAGAVLFSPSHGQVEAGVLADWLLADRLPVRMQIQMHKLLWGNAQGR